MASVVTILVNARNNASSALSSVTNAVNRMGNNVRAQTSQMTSSISSLTSRWFATSRAVSSVAGAYQDANGQWRNANGTLVLQRNHVTQVTTSFGRLVNVLGNAGQSVAQLGQRIGSGISGMLPSAIQGLPAQAQAAIVAAGTAIGVTLVTAIGAAVNGLLLTAIGGATLAAGISAAAKDPRVAGAFKALGQQVASDIKGFAQVFVEPLVAAAERFRSAWSGAVGGGIQQAFATLASTVGPLADGLAGLAERAMPGFLNAIEASKPVLLKLAQLLPEIGAALSDFFDSLADGGEGAVKGLTLVVIILTTTLNILGETIEALSKAFDWLSQKGEEVNTTLGKIPILGAPFEWLGEKLAAFNAAAESGSGMLVALGDNMLGTAGKTEAAAKATAELNQKMDDLFNRMTTATDAAIAYEQAIDDLTAAVRENGRSIDITTQAGRNNVSAVEAVARAAYQAREAAIAMAGGQNASQSAVEAANQKFREQIGALEAQLKAMGFTKAQIDSLLASWRNLAGAPDISKRIAIHTSYTSSGQRVTEYSDGTKSVTNNKFNRFGGLYARTGLVNLNGMARLFPAGATPTYGFAEAGTGGEAFIARNAPRGRSLQIAQAAASWHGATVVPHEAMRNGAGAGSGGGGAGVVNVHLHVAGSIRSDRDLIALIRNEFQNGGFRGVVRAA